MADSNAPTKVLKVKNLETGSTFEIASASFVGMEKDKMPGTNRPLYKVIEGVPRPQPIKKK